MVEAYKYWHKMLLFVLHGYLTSVHTSFGATLFSLGYYMDIILPVKVEIPYLRISTDIKLDETEWV